MLAFSVLFVSFFFSVKVNWILNCIVCCLSCLFVFYFCVRKRDGVLWRCVELFSYEQML